MNLKVKSLISLFFLVAYSSFAQIDDYSYQQEILGAEDQWHSLELPNELFGEVQSSLSDIRIYGITAVSDTIEIPYLINLKRDEVEKEKVGFKILNTSYNENGYYFTLEMKSNESINQIDLSFAEQNFDWRVDLEGSQDQSSWFTITEDYRILSIRNEQTDYSFTKLKFPESNYKYYRVLIKSKEKPKLQVADIFKYSVVQGTFKNHKIKSLNTSEDKVAKRTEIDVKLEMPLSVSSVSIDVENEFDYYRPVTIKYLVDSVSTEKGWIYNYRNLVSGTLNSIEMNEFSVPDKIIQNLKIIIYNQDNEPLFITGVNVKGHVYELVTRMNKPATYYLTYGNKKSAAPRYDITRFQDNIPAELVAIGLGEMKITKKAVVKPVEPLISNDLWLWGVMLVIMALLGWFSVKMMKKN